MNSQMASIHDGFVSMLNSLEPVPVAFRQAHDDLLTVSALSRDYFLSGPRLDSSAFLAWIEGLEVVNIRFFGAAEALRIQIDEACKQVPCGPYP